MKGLGFSSCSAGGFLGDSGQVSWSVEVLSRPEVPLVCVCEPGRCPRGVSTGTGLLWNSEEGTSAGWDVLLGP